MQEPGFCIVLCQALNTVVGHEITHVLEGTDAYPRLAEVITQLAKTKGEYQSRYDALAELYKDVEGADIEKELVADLVGDYLFEDTEFIQSLASGDRSTFQKIFDEIKYLCRAATAGSKEYKQLEKVKKQFQEVYREAAKSPAQEDGVRYSLAGKNQSGIEVYETSQETKDLTWEERKAKYLDVMKNEYRGRTAKFIRNGLIYYAKFDQGSLRKPIYGDSRSSSAGVKALIKAGADGDVFELVENSKYTGSRKNTKNHTKADYFDYFVKTVQIDGKVFDLIADVEKKYGDEGGYIYTLALVDNKKIKASPALGTPISGPVNSAGNTFNNNVAQNGTAVNGQKSLSEESGAQHPRNREMMYAGGGEGFSIAPPIPEGSRKRVSELERLEARRAQLEETLAQAANNADEETMNTAGAELQQVEERIQQIQSIAPPVAGSAIDGDPSAALRSAQDDSGGDGAGAEYAPVPTDADAPPEGFSIAPPVAVKFITKEETRANMQTVAQMESVADLQGNEFTAGDKHLSYEVADWFKSKGGSAYNPRIGEVTMNRRSVKDDIAHGMSPEKAAAFAAVPTVIEKGRIVEVQENWKDRGYDTATIMAPVTIGGNSYMMGVIVRQRAGENRYYVHDVFAEEYIEKEAAPFNRGRDQDHGLPGGTTSTISIAQAVMDIKRKLGIPAGKGGLCTVDQ